ncbi:MAG TPA: hypothetical protein VF338_02840 [Leptolinea sp.]
MNSQNPSLFEEKIYQATQTPDPDLQFDNALWARIVELDGQASIYPINPRRNHWSDLQTYLTERLHPSHQFVTGMVSVLAIVLAGFFLFSTPTGRALAQSIIHFFSPQTSDTIPAPTSVPQVWVEQTPGVPAPTATPLSGPAFHDQCGESIAAPRCTVEQIRNKVKFPVKELGSIPEPMHFVGANGGPDQIYIIYDTWDKSGGLILNEQPWDGDSEQKKWKIGASAVVDTVKIGNVTGEYVEGAFGYHGGEALMHWNADADNKTLQWVDDGMLFQMQSFGKHLNRNEFIALAGSLTEKPVVPNPTPTLGTVTPTEEPFDFHDRFPLTFSEAEKKAGFKLLAPLSLPEVLSFFGARYDPEQKVTMLFYIFNGEGTDGLSISEEMIPATGVTFLGNFIVGDKTDMDKYPAGTVVGYFDKVQIGKNAGEYVEGVFEGTDCCGWQWKSDPYLKTLRWQMNGKAFELQYMGMSLEKEDLLKIAAGMK